MRLPSIHSSRARAALFAAVAAALSSTGALAARPFTPEELLQTRRLDDVQGSPDGRWISFTVRQKSLGENADLKDIWIEPAAGGAARQLTRDGKSEHARWSPDGRSLLITSARTGLPQLWLFEVAPALASAPGAAAAISGGDPRQLTNLFGGADGGVFSPDGRFVAFVSDVYPQCNGDDGCNRKLAAERAGSGVSARISDHLFMRHWSSWKEGQRTHLFVLALANAAAAQPGSPSSLLAAPRDLTPGDADWPTFQLAGDDDYSFSASGEELAVAHKPALREAWSTNSDLFAIPVAGGAPRNLTEGNVGADEQPRYSPDGKWLAWRSQARDGYESDQWKLKLLDLHSGKAQVLADFDDDVGAFSWRKDSKGLVASHLVKGRFYLEGVALDGKVQRLFGSHTAGEDFTQLADGRIAFVESGMNRPPELAVIGQATSELPRGATVLGPDLYANLLAAQKPHTLTSFNSEQYAGLDVGPAPEELWAKGQDGAPLHAFVLKPPGLADGQKAPLIVLIHGGPQGAWDDAWGMRWNPTAFAARGYVVVMPNPRGSTGYGHKFEEQIRDNWGGLPYDDIQRLVDSAEQLPYVEAGHACAAGASYGGYMVDWIAGHTDRYRCLVSHDGVFDLRSSYGSTEELWFPEFEFRGTYWENPESYQKWSPSSFVQGFKTPTLVIEGERDYRVNGEQAMGMFTALQRRGVESRLLWFPDEGHWVLKPRNSQLWYHTVLDWLDAHLRGAPKGSAAANH